MKTTWFIAPLMFFTAAISSAQTKHNNTKASPLDRRVDSLIRLMTVQEKIDQLANNGFMTTPDNKRLGIPGFVMDDGPHGVRFQKATAFPTGIAMAATWDRNLAYQTGKAMGEEFWAFGKHQQLGPCIDLLQDARGGRSAESGGEDPYLVGQLGAQVAMGIQTTPVIATAKHFMIEGKQHTRNTRNEEFTDRWVMEHYGYNFRTLVQQAGVLSIMSSYNLINGSHAAESPYLLDTVLRQRWGFPFYVVSDWAAVHQSKPAIAAGNDLCMGSDNYKNELPALISSGQVTIAQLDAAVKNELRTKIMAGMLDFYPKGDKQLINSPQHQQVTLNAARASVILLKNEDHILPLHSTSVKEILVVGPNADKGNLNCFGSSETTPPYAVSVLQGLKNRLPGIVIEYVKGCDINSDSESGFAEAKKAAATADYVIFAGGLDATQEGEEYDSGHDRTGNSTVLPGKQQKLISELAAVNKNTIAVIQSGGICSMHQSLPAIKGLIYSFYAGQEAGNAIADVITGKYNPAGRLPVTMPVNDAQLPEWNDDYTDDFGNGYRWFDEKHLKPEFAFGFGLSYASFKYANLIVTPAKLAAGDPIVVKFDVENTSNVNGDEVAQLYVSHASANLWMPQKELKHFERIGLLAHQKKTITFTLTAEDLYYWDSTRKTYATDAGAYTIRVGGSSDKLPLTHTINLAPSASKPDLAITKLYTMPRYPKVGERVSFYAFVKNQGNGAITKSNLVDLNFKIGNLNVASANGINLNIAPGQAQFIAATINNWIPTQAGKKMLSSTIKTRNAVESISINNSTTSTIQVYPKGSK